MWEEKKRLKRVKSTFIIELVVCEEWPHLELVEFQQVTVTAE